MSKTLKTVLATAAVVLCVCTLLAILFMHEIGVWMVRFLTESVQ